MAQLLSSWHLNLSQSVKDAMVAVAMIIYQLLYMQVHLWELQQHRIIHLGFALVLLTYSLLKNKLQFLET